MSSVILSPARLEGTVEIPPSKSAAHRALICAALARGKSRIYPVELSKDIQATMRALETLGVFCKLEGKSLEMDSGGLFSRPEAVIDCIESGSTLRFLIPVAAAGGISARFAGRGLLPQRPIGVYMDCLPKAGVRCESIDRPQGEFPHGEGDCPEERAFLKIGGRLRPGVFELPGNVSSQFITGLLLALPLLDGGSEIRLTSPLESKGYVDLTRQIMAGFGVQVEETDGGWRIPGGQSYLSREFQVEGDWSQAAFFMAAGALGGNLTLKGLSRSSLQGDREGERVFRSMGASLVWKGEDLCVSPGKLEGIAVDAAQIPDLVPIIAAAASLAEGRTSIFGAQRLRLKESDRLSSMTKAVSALGGTIAERSDGLEISGVETLHGGKVDGCNDHRIVMAMAIAALRADGPVEISDAQSIEKSYPSFFEEYQRLGGKINVIHMGKPD